MVYSFYQLLWLYMIYSFIGWCGEVAVAAVKRHRFVNRGAVSGPFCPIYGLGAAVVAVFFPELKGNPLFLFLGGMVVNTFVEYVREKFGDIACECLLRGHGHGIVMAFTYYPDINEYQGVRTPQIVIQNYK